MVKKLLILVLVLSIIVPMGFSESLQCSAKEITKENNFISCFYTPDYKRSLEVNVEGIEILKIKKGSDIVYPPNKWTFEIYPDLDKLDNKVYNIKIKANDKEVNLPIKINKGEDIAIESIETDFRENKNLLKIKIKNNSNKTKKIFLNLKNEENNLNLETFVYANSKISFAIPFNYTKSTEIKKLNLSISYKSNGKVKKINKEISLDPFEMPIFESKSGFFALGNSSTMIVIDIILLIIAIVLFTMFISRLGKTIVKG